MLLEFRRQLITRLNEEETSLLDALINGPQDQIQTRIGEVRGIRRAKDIIAESIKKFGEL